MNEDIKKEYEASLKSIETENNINNFRKHEKICESVISEL